MNLIDFHGVGEAAVKALAKYGLNTPEDLLLLFPKDYKDTTHVSEISKLVPGQKSLIEGRVSNVNHRNFGRKFLRFRVSDGTGFCNIVLFRFYPNQITSLERAEVVRCYGAVDVSDGMQMVHPDWAVVNGDRCTLEKKISATYGLHKIPDKTVANIISKVLQTNVIKNILPDEYVKQYSLMNFSDALYYIHALTNTINIKYLSRAKNSIKFEEMLAYKLAEDNIKKDVQDSKAPIFKIKSADMQGFYEALPYELTSAQSRVITDIKKDIIHDSPMIRLLQGDVGSGKTIVATAAMYVAHKSGYQSAIMAPTEILAEQHYNFLSEFFSKFDIEVVALLGKLTAKQTREALEKIKTLKNCIVVGTHAIFQERVEYKNLGLVIVDEQHRFGVEQRLALINKSNNINKVPHQLIISATPIPRTLAMTVYGNLEVSILDELPPGRKPIVTAVLNRAKKSSVIAKLRSAVANGEQIYWVCPLVEESENLEFLQDVKTLHKELSLEFGEERVGIVYGSMKSKDKVAAMNDFKVAKYDILVATTVIEVGVDVPNASIMIIDNSERLGISQLHQLRGRVGRGSKDSYCLLLYGDRISEVGKRRLSLLRDSQDGFYLAEKDLEIRGAGDILGKQQSGVSTFRTFDINEYYDSFERVSHVADDMAKNYPEKAELLVNKWFGHRVNYVDV